MTTYTLVYPMFAMVLLTATVLVIMFGSRRRAIREKALASAYFRVFQGGTEPEYAVKPARHFINLFEAPTLFYAACLAALATRTTGPVILALAWAYFAVRVAHAWIHIGRNRLRHRIPVYATSWAVLLALWICVVVAVARTESAAPTPKTAAPTAALPAGETGARSSTFRAQGNEPGWMAEVKLSDQPSIHAEVDYGNTRFEISNAIEDQTGWSGTTADGTQVALRFERVECLDDMSGEKFEARAVLTAAGKDYRGCGRFRSN